MSNNMFQAEIKFITDFTLNNVKKLGAFFTFEKLLDTNIHPAIKQYLNAEFEYLIYEDRQKLIEKSLFDYSGSKISHYFELISDEIKKTKKVSFEDIKILISRAVSFNVSYVIKPNWSLQKLVFGEKKNITVGELELVLNYPYYYDYFKNVFKAYLSKRNVINISSTEFELIMNKVDRELFSVHFEKLVDNSISSIADLFSIGGLNKRSLSVEAVELFLKEKNLIDHLLRLKRAIPDPGKKKYDIDDIRKIIFSATPIEPDSISPAIDDESIKLEGDFEKVKTLEEAEIKHFTHSDNEDSDSEKTDENIIEEIVQDEIVKHDIEELIDVESSTDGSVNAEAEKLFEKEILEETGSDLAEDIPPVEKIIPKENSVKNIKSEEQKFSPNVEEISKAESILNDDDSVSTEEISEDEELLGILSGDEEVNEESLLLSDKDEEDLFSFYDEELKEMSNENEEEEIINLDELELNTDDDSEKEIFNASIGEDVVVNPDEKNQTEDLKSSEPEIESETTDIGKDSDEESPAEAVKKPRDIFSFLTSKEINKITDAIFSSDSEDFANTVEKISECPSYEKATEILKALYSSSKISPQSKQAVMLTNAVANYFDQV